MADANLEARIEQFRKMASDDPNNELGHFSLGRACLDAGRDADAIASFELRAVDQPEPEQGLPAPGHRAAATGPARDRRRASHARGVEGRRARRRAAAHRNDADADRAGGAHPRIEEPSGRRSARRRGPGPLQTLRPSAPKLAKPPFRNAFGQEIFDNTCTDCWREAIGQGTKVINEPPPAHERSAGSEAVGHSHSRVPEFATLTHAQKGHWSFVLCRLARLPQVGFEPTRRGFSVRGLCRDWATAAEGRP